MRRKDITENKLRRELRAMINTGEAPKSELARQWKKDPVKFIGEKANLKITEAHEKIIRAITCGKYHDLLIIGPRGGGKTIVISVTVGCQFAFDEDDVMHMGGSLDQAKYGHEYLDNYLFTVDELKDELSESHKTIAKGKRGNWYRIGACSMKFARSKHAGDPHAKMGNVAHGGILFIDEAAEAKGNIIDAALDCVNTAEPDLTIRASTDHIPNSQFGDVVDDPEGAGIDKVIRFDIFDVTEKCTYSCRKCVPEFAGNKLDLKDYKQLCQARSEDHKGPKRLKGYCEGRAKKHRPGHFRIKKLRRFFKKKGREKFETEYLNIRPGREGAIISRTYLDKCLSGVNLPIRNQPEANTGIGMDPSPNFTAMVALQLQGAQTIAIMGARHIIGQTEDLNIVNAGIELKEKTGATFAYTDNAQIILARRVGQEADMPVTAFIFSQASKEGAITLMRRAVEETRFLIPGRKVGPGKYEFPDPYIEELYWQLAHWKRDENGKVVKKDDHYPDAICTVVEIFMYGTGNRAKAAPPKHTRKTTRRRRNRSGMPGIRNDSPTGFYN